MIGKVHSHAVLGINAYEVEVEADLSGGQPYFGIVGLPDPAVKEIKDRVKAALLNSGNPCLSKCIDLLHVRTT
jgi:magnesium chelatase family protein